MKNQRMKYLLMLLIFLPFAFQGNSQVITEAEMTELLNSREIQVDNPMISNFLTIEQISDDNSATSIQNNPGAAVNTVMVTQDGIGNTGYINQNGSGNETRLWQYNSSNEASLWSEGNNITTLAKQDGEGNVIKSYIENPGLDARTAMLIQEGNRNRIELALYGDAMPTGVSSQDVKVSQYGNNHTVQLMKEDYFNPIEITQTPGAGGAGMHVNVSSSWIDFPLKN